MLPPAADPKWLKQVTLLCLLISLITSCTSLKRCAYEGFDRDSWQKPEQVIHALDIQPGQHLSDLGAGSGYFTFRLSDAVGPSGKVYAVDVDPGMVVFLKNRSEETGYSNIVTILSDPKDPSLPEARIDLILVCNTYHHIENRENYFRRLHKYLSKNGRIAIIDFSGKGWIIRLSGHWVPQDTILREMEAAGYRLQQDHEFLPRHNFLLFAPSLP